MGAHGSKEPTPRSIHSVDVCAGLLGGHSATQHHGAAADATRRLPSLEVAVHGLANV